MKYYVTFFSGGRELYKVSSINNLVEELKVHKISYNSIKEIYTEREVEEAQKKEGRV